jgi:hypothetical protein
VPLEVCDASDVVDHGEVRDVVEEAVDREVAPDGVLGGGAEGVVGADQEVDVARCARFGLLRLRTLPEGGDLDELSPVEEDVGEPEAAADDAAVAEEPADVLRAGVGPDVESFGSVRQEIAYGAADEVREPGPVQAVKPSGRRGRCSRARWGARRGG